MRSCLFYTGCVLRSPWGTSNSTEPAGAPPALQKKKKLLLVRVRDLCFGSCVSWVMLQMPDGGGYLLVCGFLCSNAGIPSASQSPHASKSCSIRCAHNVKAPQRCVQLQRDYKDMFALKGLCWLRNDCNRISLNLHSALLIVWGFVSLLLSFSLSFSLFFLWKVAGLILSEHDSYP